MTQNAWGTDYLDANGETLIGNGTNPPSVSKITGGANCNVVPTANGIQLTYTGSTSGDYVLTHTASASGSSSLDFTGLSSTYFCYMLVVDNFVPATDGDRLQYRTSTDDGVSWDSGASDYYFRGWIVDDSSTVAAVDADSANTNIIGSSGTPPGNAANETSSAISFFYNPSASDYLRSTNLHVLMNTSTNLESGSISSGRKQAVAVNGIQLLCASGTITSAEVRIYGMVAA